MANVRGDTGDQLFVKGGAPPAVDRNASIRSKMPKVLGIRRQSYYSTRERARLSAALKALEVSVDISFVHKTRLLRYTGAICLDSALPFPYYARLPFFWYRPEYWAARIKSLTDQQRGTPAYPGHLCLWLFDQADWSKSKIRQMQPSELSGPRSGHPGKLPTGVSDSFHSGARSAH